MQTIMAARVGQDGILSLELAGHHIGSQVTPETLGRLVANFLTETAYQQHRFLLCSNLLMPPFPTHLRELSSIFAAT